MKWLPPAKKLHQKKHIQFYQIPDNKDEAKNTRTNLPPKHNYLSYLPVVYQQQKVQEKNEDKFYAIAAGS